MYVLEAEVSSCGVARLDDIEEVGVGVRVKERKVGGLAPAMDEIGIVVARRIAFDCGKGRRMREIKVILYRGEEGQDVLFELEADEFFRTHVAHRFGSGRVILVPGVVDCGA